MANQEPQELARNKKHKTQEQKSEWNLAKAVERRKRGQIKKIEVRVRRRQSEEGKVEINVLSSEGIIT